MILSNRYLEKSEKMKKLITEKNLINILGSFLTII